MKRTLPAGFHLCITVWPQQCAGCPDRIDPEEPHALGSDGKHWHADCADVQSEEAGKQ